jgi:hypothetical protein
MLWHEAALACGKLTRGDTGGQPTPSEVIMSRPNREKFEEILRVSGFELVKWPINICALELALSYGIGRALRLAFAPSAVPMEFLIVSVAIVGFISALTVSRYMPSDEALE